MKKGDISPIDRDVMRRIKDDAEFAEAYYEELSERPISIQFAILRRFHGVTQEKMASMLKVRQSYVSKLEKEGSDHLISNYEKAVQLLHGRLAIIPKKYRLLIR